MRYAVIMAGGYGERFWPLSRKERPKQCIPIHTEKPMIQETADRLRGLFGGNIYVSTGEKLAEQIKGIMPDVGFVVEPMARNTAACIGLSAVSLLAKDPEAVMFIETADHIYQDIDRYLEHVRFALDTAESSDKIVLIGIKPGHAHTGLGYIEMSDLEYDDRIKVHKVKAFKEKPDLKTAEEYVNSGNYLWNSGMFIARCSVMLEEIKRYLPEMYDGLIRIKDSGFDKDVLRNEFEKMEKISIDYGVMERSDNTLVLKADMHWDDIGDLAAFDRFAQRDENGNVVRGKSIGIDSNNNIIISDNFDKLVGLIGIKDKIIVDDNDVLLIAEKNRAQEVKDIVRKLG